MLEVAYDKIKKLIELATCPGGTLPKCQLNWAPAWLDGWKIAAVKLL